MNDLLPLVRAQQAALADDIEDGLSDVPESEFGNDLKTFFEDVEKVRTDLTEIKQLNVEIREMHEKSKTIVRTKELAAQKANLQNKIDSVNGIAQSVKAKLEQIDKANDLSKTKKRCGEGSAAERTRTTISAAMKKRLKENMAEFTELRNTIQEDYKETIEKRMYTVTGQKMKEEDIEKITQGGGGEEIFQKAIMEQGRGRVLDALSEIQERNAGVKDIEKSLLELHQIFVDMAALVEAQGEILDNIEKQVQRSVEFVQSGVQNLQEAKEIQKGNRLILCIGLAVVLGGLVFLIIVILVVMKVL